MCGGREDEEGDRREDDHVRDGTSCQRYSQSCFSCRIWTCFEYVMKLTPDLMRDRHMDQLIMCSVYVLSKVSI